MRKISLIRICFHICDLCWKESDFLILTHHSPLGISAGEIFSFKE